MIRALPIVDCPPSTDAEPGFGSLRGPRGALPLAVFTADLAVAGPVWRWRIRQVFANPGRDAIEAVYIFPLPPRGAVTAFRMRVAGRLVEGDLQERGAARQVYAQAVSEGKRAALLEEDRPDVFTVQVGNIQAGERAEVELELSGQVAVEDGIASVRLPLVVAPRYIPGEAIGDDVGAGTAGDTAAVPDASRITPPVLLPGFPNPVRLGITLAVGGVDESGLACTLPTVADGAGRWRVEPGQRLDRDCIIRWSARSAELSARALAATGAAGGGCTLAVSVIPPASMAAAARPRDVVVLLDRSGSMGGWKMVAARRAAARLVDALDSRDRFAALAFDDSVEGHDGAKPALHAATDRARFAAVGWLTGIDARGGTEMTPAMDAAFKLLAGEDESRERILVLVTDAQIGDEDRLLKRHAKALRRTRVVALGIDQAVNEGLLGRLVGPNGGWYACVESEDWLDQVMAVAARAVQPPALADIVVETADGPLPACTPDPVPDAWASRPLTLWARLPAVPATVTIRGVRADGSPWRSEIPVQVVAEPAINAAWARGRIRDLEDRHAIAASAELAAEIVRISLAEKVLSRFTAFVAVDHEIAGDGKPRTVVQAVETPAGWETPELAKKSAGPGGPIATTSACAPPPPSPMCAKPSMSKQRSRVASRLVQESVLDDMLEGEADRLRIDPADLAKRLLSTLRPHAGDRLRIALALRSASITGELHQLIAELRSEPSGSTPKQVRHRLAEQLAVLMKRIARPATIEAVAAAWPEIQAILAEIEGLPSGPEVSGPETSGPDDGPRPGRGAFWK